MHITVKRVLSRGEEWGCGSDEWTICECWVGMGVVVECGVLECSVRYMGV